MSRVGEEICSCSRCWPNVTACLSVAGAATHVPDIDDPARRSSPQHDTRIGVEANNPNTPNTPNTLPCH